MVAKRFHLIAHPPGLLCVKTYTTPEHIAESSHLSGNEHRTIYIANKVAKKAPQN